MEKDRHRLIIDMPDKALEILAKEGKSLGKSRKAYMEKVLIDKTEELTKKK